MQRHNDDVDLLLIRRAAEGDGASFAELYERHAATVLRLARRIVRDTAEAEEVMHEVFLQAWRQLRRFDPACAPVVGWLLMIARTRSLDRVRRVRRRLPIENSDSAQAAVMPTPEADCDERDRRGALRHMLNGLSRVERQPLELALITGLTHSDIARELRLPLGTIKTRLRTAFAHLRHDLSDPRRLSEAAAIYASVPHAGAVPPQALPAGADTSGGSDAALLAGIDVLIADDDADTRVIVAAILSRAGAIVRAGASADEATGLASDRWPDVLLSDIAMPGGDGYHLLRHLRSLSHGAGRHLPAVAFTASTSDHEARMALTAGYDRHVVKPVHPAALVDTVRSVSMNVG